MPHARVHAAHGISMEGRSSSRRTAHAGSFPPIAIEQQQPEASKRSRVARWTGHLKTAVKRIILGYDPAEEREAAEYAVAMQDFATRGKAIVDARDAAIAEAQGLPRSDPEEEFLFSNREEVVELDVTASASPLEEDIMASLRRRMQLMQSEPEAAAEEDSVESFEAAPSLLRDNSDELLQRSGDDSADSEDPRVEEVKLGSEEAIERARRMFGMH